MLISSHDDTAVPRRKARRIFGVDLSKPYAILTIALAINWTGDIIGWWG